MRLKHLLSVFLTLLTLSVGQMWGITVSDLSTSAATTITNGGQYVVATAYNGNYLTTGVSGGFGTATTVIGSAAIFTAHGTTSGFYLTCSAGRLVPASSKTFNAYDNGTTNNLSLSNAGKIQNSSNTSWTLQLNSNFRWYSSSQTAVYLYAVNTSSPSLSVSNNATSLAMGDAKVNGSGVTNNTLTFSGANLTANATLSITGTNAGMFSVTPTNVSKGSGTIANQAINVTYTPTAAGNHTATLTISSGTTSKTITLSGTGKYEVIWKCDGSDDVTTLVASGSRPTFPSTPTSCDTGEGASTSFYGWATSTWSGKAASLEDSKLSGITIYTQATEMPTVTGNGVVYNAVFCKGGSLTYATSIAANDVVYLATSTASGASGVAGANSNGKDANVSTTQADWMAFTVQANSTGWKLKNGSNYIQATAKNFAFTTGTPNVLTFEQEGSTGKYRMIFTIASGNDAGTYALSKNSSGDYWRFYKTSNSYNWYYVVKASAGTNYMTTCCTELGQINGSFFGTTHFGALSPEKFRPERP